MSTALSTCFMQSPVGSLDAYINRVSQIPMLTAEEEKAYALRLYEHNDMDAARKLIYAHLRYVVRVAQGYKGYGLAVGDLIQEGNVGLMKAVKRYNPHMGVRLVTFAVHWIKSEIHEFILKNWRIVKIATTKAQRKLFFNLRQYKKRLGWFKQDEIEAVAQDLGVSPRDVVQMEERMNRLDETFDSPESSSDEQAYSPEQYLASSAINPADAIEQEHENNRLTHVQNALEDLNDREKMIIQQRYLSEKKSTLHDLAKELKVSAERVRQIEKSAIESIKAQLSPAKS